MKNLRFDSGVYYCGIDPGFSGAIAILDFNYDIVHYMDMPVHTILKKRVLDEPAICMVFRKYNPMIVGIEKAQTMPGQGLVSSGRYMDSYGFLRGMCVGMKYQYHLIRPTSWKKKMLFDMPKDKHSSIVKVGQIYPEIELLRKKDHGIADAILIARYMISEITPPLSLPHPRWQEKSLEDQVVGI